MKTACEDAALASPAAAVTAFAQRPEAFREITSVDVYGDCLHLYNDVNERLVLQAPGLSKTPSRGSGAAVKILSAAGFGHATDEAGHGLRSMIELGCCGGGTMSMTELNGVISVFRHQ